MGAKSIPGVFVGCRIHPGGLWSGDYLVAELAPFRKNYDVARSKVKIHRIREVVTNRAGKFAYPVAKWRQQGLLRGVDFDMPTDPEMPELCDLSDDDDDLPKPLGSSKDGVGILSASSDPPHTWPATLSDVSTPR